MRALTIRGYGDNDALEFADLPDPRPGPDEVLIAVRAAGVNPLDVKTRAGALRRVRRYAFPLILGNEVSGVVAAVGSAVTGFAPGDEVYARLDKDRLGGFAEYVTVAAALVARKPATIGHDLAAAIPLAAQTAWQALTDSGPLGGGSTVLVHGGAGGVGTFAVQFGRHLGATVIATASARNAALVSDLGADLVIDYRTESFVERMRALGHEADLVLDTQGGAVLHRSFEVVRRGGTVVTIAGLPTPDAVRGQANAVVRALLAAVHLGNRRRARRAGARFGYLFQRPDGGHLRQFAELVDSGRLRPVIDRVVPFADAPQALAHVERGGGPGKTVLSVLTSAR